MTRILHTGDWHIGNTTHTSGNAIDQSTGAPTRWQSTLRAAASTVDAGIENDVDLALITGDTFDRYQPTAAGYHAAADLLSPFGEAGIPVVMVRGNHERVGLRPGEVSSLQPLAAMLRARGVDVTLIEDPSLVEVAGISVVGLPWLDRVSVLHDVGQPNVAPAEGDVLVTMHGLDRVEALAAKATGPVIIAGHFTVDSLRLPTNGEHVPGRASEVSMSHVFWEPVFPVARLTDVVGADGFVGLGHIHLRQQIGACYYAGAPEQFRFDDAGHAKSANIVTLTGQGTVESVRQVPTDHRVMDRVDMAADDAEARLQGVQSGSLVQVRLRPGEVDLDPEVRRMVESAGAVPMVVPGPTVAPEIVRRATTLAEDTGVEAALRAFLAERYPDEDPEAVITLGHVLLEGSLR